MSRIATGLLLFLGVTTAMFAQDKPPVTIPRPEAPHAMVVWVSPWFIGGGIGPNAKVPAHRLALEEIAYVDADGNWSDFGCSAGREGQVEASRRCEEFAKTYLSKTHTYTVVSSNGEGGRLKTSPVNLSECFDYSTEGSFEGADNKTYSIAASDATLFEHAPRPESVSSPAPEDILSALRSLVPSRLDSTKRLNVYRIQLEGHSFVVLQRTYKDFAGKPDPERMKLIFAIGSEKYGDIKVLHWKENTDDEEERILGTIRLKSGREFLITSVNDPEGQWFHIYGIRNGQLQLIYTGGGSSC